MRQFGELEAVIMDRLWEWGRPALVREMVDDLRRDRPLAYTTVMTVMENLHRKGWLRRERDGRAWRYEPTGSRSAYTAALMNDALGTSTDRRTALAHFVLQMSPHDGKVDKGERHFRDFPCRLDGPVGRALPGLSLDLFGHAPPPPPIAPRTVLLPGAGRTGVIPYA